MSKKLSREADQAQSEANRRSRESGKVVDYLPWVHSFVRNDAAYRRGWVKRVLDAIKGYRGGRQGPFLTDELSDKSRYELVGVVPKIEYLMVENRTGDPSHMQALHVHPFAGPVLAYFDKKCPRIILVAPGLRLDGSILQEVPGNPSDDSIGFNG